MARITDIATTFANVGPLAADEIWQVHDGTVLISLESGSDDNRGIRMTRFETLPIIAGKTVYYRRVDSSSAILSREVVG